MIRLLPYCLSGAAVVGASAYLAADRAVLAEIGLSAGPDGLHEMSSPANPVLAGAAARTPTADVRRGGPVCWDVLLWPGDTSPLPFRPSDNSGGITIHDLTGPILPRGDLAMMAPVHIAQAQPVSVPEPSSLALLVAGLVALARVRRRV